MVEYVPGQMWKTRGGWKAMVLESGGETAKVWHNRDGQESILNHSEAMEKSQHGLMEPWIEPESIILKEKIYIWKDGGSYFSSLVPASKGELFAIYNVNKKVKKGDGL